MLVLVLALPAVAASPRRAELELESIAPLVVRGKHFGKREAVILTYLGGDLRRVVGVRSTQSGRFRHAFALSIDRCARFTIRAVGFRGSRAVLQVEPMCKERKGPQRARD